MALIDNVHEVLHRIRAKLYPNYLHGIDGACPKPAALGLGVCA